MKYLISIMLFMISFNVYALDINQKVNLLLAYEYGNTIRYENEPMGLTIASIVYQETKGGYHKYTTDGVIIGDSKSKIKSLGLMQVQLPAAKDVKRWYPEVFVSKFGNQSPTDNQIKIELLTDNVFNISVGTHYFLKMLELSDGNWNNAILAYNAGIKHEGRDRNKYVPKVLHWRNTVVKDIIDDQFTHDHGGLIRWSFTRKYENLLRHQQLHMVAKNITEKKNIKTN